MSYVVSLPKDLQEFVRDSVKSGRFVAESEVLVEAVETLKAREDFRQFQLRELKEKIQVGLDSLDRDGGAPWNLNEILDGGRRLLASEQS
jgi:putative addiction module CopG family antidote